MVKPTIGLEIHVQLATATKMFCSCANDPHDTTPNTNVCPVCMGHPGTLPVPNQKAIDLVLKTGIALECSVNTHSKFDRKNYFYPDLPKGYQITQYDQPLCFEGRMTVLLADQSNRNQEEGGAGTTVRIRRIHIEEDTGRLQHEGQHSLVDYNRAGVPLMELVTEPDFHSGEEASAFAQELQLTLRYLEVSNADMEKGEMRVEANVSVSATDTLGQKVELKNLNSFKSVRDSIDFEIERQTALVEKGQVVVHETRGWHVEKRETFIQRTKETEADYRYFPEPDMPPLEFDGAYIKAITDSLGELPAQRRARFLDDYALPTKHIDTLVSNKELAEYFEGVVSELPETEQGLNADEVKQGTQLAANYVLTHVLKMVQGDILSTLHEKISQENFAEFIAYIVKGVVSSTGAQTLLAKMYETGGDPTELLKSLDLTQVSGEGELQAIVSGVISEQPKAAGDYRSGKTEVLKFLVGKVMAASKGKANPQVAEKLLKEALK